MPLLRLAYTTLFLIALIAVFFTWSEVGGSGHLELLPWYIKLSLGLAMAFTIVRAAAAAVAGERPWNAQTVRWLGLTLALALICGLSSYYAHLYFEDEGDESDQSDTTVSRLERRKVPPPQ